MKTDLADSLGIVNNRPKGLRRTRALLEEQLGKAFDEQGRNARDGIACGGTAIQFARESADTMGAEEHRFAEDPNEALDPKALRAVAIWALVAAGLLDAEASRES